MRNRGTIIDALVFFICTADSLFLLFGANKSGFENIWLLPLTFGVCFFILRRAVSDSRGVLFYFFFTCVSALRYTVSPFLLVISGEYFGRMASYSPSAATVRKAVFLMVYELIICAFFIFLFENVDLKDRRKKEPMPEIMLPQGIWAYALIIGVTLIMTVIRPGALGYFSFGLSGMKNYDLSSGDFIEKLTVMLLLCGKSILFITVLSFIRKKYDLSGENKKYLAAAFVFTCLSSIVYAGHNRADFLFSVLAEFFVFSLMFKKGRKLCIISGLLITAVILPFMTAKRGYGDYYAEQEGLKKLISEGSSTLEMYFGGITNVSVSIDFAEQYGAYNTPVQLLKDIFAPVVGLNELLPFRDLTITNTLFNYTFFGKVRQPTQILPSIGHGYFYFGFALAPVFDIIQLYIASALGKSLKKSPKAEKVYLYNLILLRFALMFGQNLTQQINGISMKLLLPLAVFYVNDKIRIKK